MFRFSVAATVVVGGLLLQGCASVIEGTSQELPVITDPPYAVCDIWQKGKLVAATSDDSPVAYIGKSREPLTVMCNAPGHDPKTVHVVSGASGWGVVSIWAWDFGITDWIAGGLNRYPGAIGVALTPGRGPIAAQMRTDALAEIPNRPYLFNGYNPQTYVRPARVIAY